MSLDRNEIKKYKESIPFLVRKSAYDKLIDDNPGKFPAVLIKAKNCKYDVPTHK